MSDDTKMRPEGVVGRMDRLEVRMDAVVDALQRISAVMDDATEHLEVEGLPPIPKEDMDALKGIVMDEARADIKEAAERGMGRGAMPSFVQTFLRWHHDGPKYPHPEDTETAPATEQPRWERVAHMAVDLSGKPQEVALDQHFWKTPALKRYKELPLVREADAEATVRELEERLGAAEQHVLILREEVRRMREQLNAYRDIRPKGPTQHDLSERREP